MLKKSLLLSTIVLFVICFTQTEARSAVSYVGKITIAEGKVYVARKGAKKYARAKKGTTLFAGDRVRTLKRSKAQIRLRDNTVINIAPKTSLRVSALVYDKKKETRSGLIEAFKGKIRLSVSKVMKVAKSGKLRPWRKSSFKVNSDYSCGYILNKTSVFCFTSLNFFSCFLAFSYVS